MHSFIHLFRVTDQKAPRCKWHDKRKASCQKMLMPNGTENASKDCYREQNRETLERKTRTRKKVLSLCVEFFSVVCHHRVQKWLFRFAKKKFIHSSSTKSKNSAAGRRSQVCGDKSAKKSGAVMRVFVLLPFLLLPFYMSQIPHSLKM